MSETLSDRLNQELQRIYNAHGLLVPDVVVKEAADPDNPLHDQFTWDDSEAAAKWRREEAGYLIRKARIVVQRDPDTTHKVRAFVSVLHKGDRGYMPTKRALTEHRDQVIEQALRDLEAMRRRYEGLVDFDEVLRRALAKSEAA